MRQILQSFKTGETLLETVPVPRLEKGCVLIQTTHTLVSLGTERMLVEFGKASLLAKTRQQPEKVVQVLNKMKEEGYSSNTRGCFNKLGRAYTFGLFQC